MEKWPCAPTCDKIVAVTQGWRGHLAGVTGGADMERPSAGRRVR